MTALDKRLQDNNNIVTSIYKDKPNEAGLSSFERHSTFEEFRTQVIAVLKNTPVAGGETNAYIASEYITDPRECSSPRKKHIFSEAEGRIFAVPRHGNCEGHIISLVHLRSDGTYEKLINIKYFLDGDDVLVITKRLMDALHNGY